MHDHAHDHEPHRANDHELVHTHGPHVDREAHFHGDALEALRRNERRTWWVVAITSVTMLVELAAGWLTGSMALLADGWHMASHAGALGLSGVAYWYARTRAREERFAFGTGKVYALAGFASAVALAIVALLMAVESIARLVVPTVVRFDEALPVAVIGFAVNLVSARLLHASHHDHDGAHGDHNLRAAYLHVLADALTSVLAIAALLAGRFLEWTRLDPLMGVVGGVIILRWAWGLSRSAGVQLLDIAPEGTTESDVRHALEHAGAVQVLDVRVWRTAPGCLACLAVIETRAAETSDRYRAAVLERVRLAHFVLETRETRPR